MSAAQDRNNVVRLKGRPPLCEGCGCPVTYDFKTHQSRHIGLDPGHDAQPFFCKVLGCQQWVTNGSGAFAFCDDHEPSKTT